MKQSYDSLVKRIQRFSMTCDIKDENGVVHHFHHGHEYIEIGGIKWATMNVGAEKPTNNGLYFAWGGSQGYTADQVKKGVKRFDWADYKYGNGTTGLIKYNLTDGKITLGAEDDGVAANWGGKWRMPTSDELQTLKNAVTTALTNDYKGGGVRGLVCTAKDGSGAELFFPAAGYCDNDRVYTVDFYGFYWSSSLNSSGVYQAYLLYFTSGYVNWQSISRHYGFTLRGVVGE